MILVHASVLPGIRRGKARWPSAAVTVSFTIAFLTIFGRMARGTRRSTPCLISTRQDVETPSFTRILHPSAPGTTPPICRPACRPQGRRSEEHTSELQSRLHLVCRLLLEKKKKKNDYAAKRLCTLSLRIYTYTLILCSNSSVSVTIVLC